MKEEKEICNIDLDGVIYNFDKKFAELCPELFLGDNGDDTDYEIRSKKVDEVIASCPKFFQLLEPIEGAIEAVNLLSQYYEIEFVSSPVSAVPESYTDKAIALKRDFPILHKKNLTLTHKKHRVFGHYLIDDRLKNGVKEFKGEHIHFGTDKFPDWKSVLDYLIPKA